MLLRFRAANVYSFREEFELNLLNRRRGEGRSFDPAHVAAIYGANASGKSNVLKAMNWMASAVRESATRWGATNGVARPLFKLDPAAREEASLFEAEFSLQGVRYVYGFEVSDNRVETEWLYEYVTGRRRTLFVRDADAADEYDFKGRQLKGELDQIRKLTRSNALFLSMGAQLNNPQLTKVFEWFHGGLVRAGGDPDAFENQDVGWFAGVKHLLPLADLGIVDGEFVSRRWLVQSKGVETGNEFTFQELRLQHRGVDGVVDLDPSEESDGTRTWLTTMRTVLEALREGSVVLHDELDARLHPSLVAEVLRVFRDPKANRHGAQLICTLHDVSLLGSAHADAPVDRREIWIAEKDAVGRSELYPLTDARPATQENVERGYLRGRYGGVPRVGAGWLAMDIAGVLEAEASELGAHGR